ncbi:MAG: hypothetical protein CTR55_08115 [Pseudomonas sp.]|uniref:LasR-specific antiactivator QslA n=1 Tax=Pseudomonas sp. TaxID=306 RepID=UPI000CBE7C59|nr:LasR-specific antiactivator QslA [Pseudomonas sp.]PJI49323.1 MAG: hypothetical protein CTR55_08115 [Pseudomonas sp.]
MSSDNNTLDPESALLDAQPNGDQSPVFKLPVDWPEESQLVMAYGDVVAREWLFAPGGETLWVNFAKGRTLQKDMLNRMAYEIGFLNHLQRQFERLS